MIPKKTTKKKTSQSYWKAKADKLWGKLIHLGTCCAVCGRSDIRLESHHIISRAVVNLRHDPENGILLCTTHHKYSPEISPHAGPIGWTNWLKEHYPAKYEYAVTKRFKTGKPDYKLACEKLETAIKEY